MIQSSKISGHLRTRLLVNVRYVGECWEWTRSTDSHGYGKIKIEGRSRGVHRAVYENIYGPLPKGQVVRHSCDNPPCFNPAHLLPGTQADNVADMLERGRQRKSLRTPQPKKGQALGSRHGQSKLTEEIVWEIRDAYSRGEVTQRDLAEKYGVTQSTISRALDRLLWTHI